MLNSMPPVNVVSLTNKVSPVEQKTRPRRRSILREFCLNSSAHGLAGVVRGKSIYNRAFWLISFTAFAGAMIYFVIQAIIAYFDYPTNRLDTPSVDFDQDKRPYHPVL